MIADRQLLADADRRLLADADRRLLADADADRRLLADADADADRRLLADADADADADREPLLGIRLASGEPYSAARRKDLYFFHRQLARLSIATS